MQEQTFGPELDSGHGSLFGTDVDFRQLLENLPAGAYMCDPDGLITYFNQRAVDLWGRAPKLNDPLDRYCGSWKLYAADRTPLDHSQCWMAQALKAGQEFIGQEIVIERLDGSFVTVLAHASPIRDESGRLLGAVNVLVDIDRTKRVEDALAATKEELASQVRDLRRLHGMSTRLSASLELGPILDETLRTAAAIEGTDLGVLLMCDPEQNTLYAAASLGFDDEFLNLIGTVRPGLGACGTAFKDKRRVIVEDVETDPIFASCIELARKAGFRAVHSTPLINREGKLLGVLTTHFRQPHRPTDREMHLIDLCARQVANCIDNAQLYAELRNADRRKDEFLATLAHELRNPLSPISNSLHILRISNDLSPAAESMCEVMERQVKHMVRLVDDLMQVSRITRGKIELKTQSVDLASIISTALEISRPQIDAARHQLAIAMRREPIILEADADRMAQVISNLLINAVKYTEPGGQIWLTVREESGEAVISVKDSGIGISADLLQRVFEMFAQGPEALDRSQGGLGIGLTLARSLVQLHGGTISAHSDGPGTGSEFVVRIPVTGTRRLAASPPVAEPEERPVPCRRILVVDDTHAAAYMLGKLLETLGQEIQVCEDGAAALEHIQAHPPDIIISDLSMPQMNGLELAQHVRQELGHEHIVMVALTGYGQEGDRQRSKAAGFDHHLVKPVSFEALRNLLANLPMPARIP